MSKEMPDWLKEELEMHATSARIMSEGYSDEYYEDGFQKCYELMSEQYETMDKMIKEMRIEIDRLLTDKENEGL